MLTRFASIISGVGCVGPEVAIHLKTLNATSLTKTSLNQYQINWFDVADRCIASKNTWTGILPLKKVRRLQGFALTNQLWEISSLQNWYGTNGAACRFFKRASCRTRFAPTEASTAPCLRRRKGVFRTNGEVGNRKEMKRMDLRRVDHVFAKLEIHKDPYMIYMYHMDNNHECPFKKNKSYTLQGMCPYPTRFQPENHRLKSARAARGHVIVPRNQPQVYPLKKNGWFWRIPIWGFPANFQGQDGASCDDRFAIFTLPAGPLCPKSRWIWKSSLYGWNLGIFQKSEAGIGGNLWVEIG